MQLLFTPPGALSFTVMRLFPVVALFSRIKKRLSTAAL
jgi:hypothetical protein